MSIRCVHGDIHEYPLVPIKIHSRGKKHCLKAAVSSRQSYLLILGIDWTGFNQVTEDLVGVRPRQLKQCEVGVSGDAGLCDAAERKATSSELCLGIPLTLEFYPMEDFPLEQSRDDTLGFAFDQVKAPIFPLLKIACIEWK